MDLDRINSLLRDHRDLDGIIVSFNPNRLWYEAVISLSEPGEHPSRVSLLFLGVCGLRMQEIGPGQTQLRRLRVTDISDRQLDRIRCEVEELDLTLLHFHCSAIEVLDDRLPSSTPSP